MGQANQVVGGTISGAGRFTAHPTGGLPQLLLDVVVGAQVDPGDIALGQGGQETGAQQGGFAHARLARNGHHLVAFDADHVIERCDLIRPAKEKRGVVFVIGNKAPERPWNWIAANRHG